MPTKPSPPATSAPGLFAGYLIIEGATPAPKTAVFPQVYRVLGFATVLKMGPISAIQWKVGAAPPWLPHLEQGWGHGCGEVLKHMPARARHISGSGAGASMTDGWPSSTCSPGPGARGGSGATPASAPRCRWRRWLGAHRQHQDMMPPPLPQAALQGTVDSSSVSIEAMMHVDAQGKHFMGAVGLGEG